jgi:Leucine-rich repeat (LRR) protein
MDKRKLAILHLKNNRIDQIAGIAQIASLEELDLVYGIESCDALCVNDIQQR